MGASPGKPTISAAVPQRSIPRPVLRWAAALRRLVSSRPAEVFAARPLFWGFAAACLAGLLAQEPWAGPWFWSALGVAALVVAAVGSRHGPLWPAAAFLLVVA